MGVVPSSPRARRRLLRLGIALGAVGAIAATAALVHGARGPNPSPGKNAPRAQLVTHSTYVSPADRRAINATLDRFMSAALDRSSPATAWHLAGPEMKAGSTLREWRTGTTPVPYFPPRETKFRGWEAVDTGPRYVVFDHLLVHGRHHPRTSSWIFAGEVVKPHSRWLVNRIYTIAIMRRPTKTGTHQVGPADYAAPPVSTEPPPRTASGTLGKPWLLAVVGLLGLVVLFPLGLGVTAGVRSRRRQRQYARPSSALPPLPGASQTRSEPVGTGAGSRTRS